MSNYKKCGAVDTQALQISILERELAEAKEQLAEKNKQAKESMERVEVLIVQADFCPHSKCSTPDNNCIECILDWVRKGH